jgi:TetR/AcrR family transcriptional repressor of nem operon
MFFELTAYRLIGISNTNQWVLSMSQPSQHKSKTRILNAASRVAQDNGRVATSIDDSCQATASTKGRLLHHFKSKQALALAAAERFSTSAEELSASTPCRMEGVPVDRLIGYVDFHTDIVAGTPLEFTGLPGTMVQDTYATRPAIREARDTGMALHIAELVKDVETAGRLYAPKTPNARGVG